MKPELKEWVQISAKIGALSFGGSGRLLLYQEAVVDQKNWLSEEEFREILTVAQVFPGPNLVNLAAWLGYQLGGFWWALIGVGLLALPGAFVIVAIVYWLNIQNPDVISVFEGFSLASVAVFSIFILRLLGGLSAALPSKRHIKYYLRVAVMILICGGSLAGYPLAQLLVFGLGVATLFEFLIGEPHGAQS
jgi:chromate transporter